MKHLARIAKLPFLFLIITGVVAPSAMAELKLPSIVADHMVLQQSQPVPIWGWAEPGEEITVTIAKQSAKAKADERGHWQAEVGPLVPGGPLMMVISNSAGDTKTVRDILVGEVWICSGQSNMEMRVSQCNNAENEIKNADYPKIRLFAVKNTVAETPQENCEGNWSVCSPATVGDYTAAGYFFARDIHKELGMPIGLLQTDWGGTPIEAWTSRKALESAPASNHS